MRLGLQGALSTHGRILATHLFPNFAPPAAPYTNSKKSIFKISHPRTAIQQLQHVSFQKNSPARRALLTLSKVIVRTCPAQRAIKNCKTLIFKICHAWRACRHLQNIEKRYFTKYKKHMEHRHPYGSIKLGAYENVSGVRFQLP